MPNLESIAGWFSGGAGIGAGLLFMKFLLDWLGLRIDKREATVEAGAARVDAATQKLIDQLQKRMEVMNDRLGRVEDDLEHCRKEHAQSRAQLAEIEAELRHCQEEHTEARKRMTALEGDLETARRELAQARAEIARKDALAAGLGDAKQQAALIVAHEKRRVVK